MKKYIISIILALVIVCAIYSIVMSPKQNVQLPQGGIITDDSSQTYTSKVDGYSIRLPKTYKVDESYVYTLGPDVEFKGTKFSIPESLSNGTNLDPDSYVSVEAIPSVSDCNANIFLSGEHTPFSVTENGQTYSVASSVDAAAGNRYEETVYVLTGTNPCLGVRYFIHYGVFETYPEDSIKMFDKQVLINQFDQIRKTLDTKLQIK